MAKPENDHNLPTPENPGDGFSIEIKNVDKIYSILRDKNYPYYCNAEFTDGDYFGVDIGELKIGDNLTRDLCFTIISKDNKSLHLPQFYQLAFKIHRQVQVGNSQRYEDGFDESKRYLDEARVKKIMDELSLAGESPVYCIDREGFQNIKLQKNGMNYVVSCGPVDIQHHWNWYIKDYDSREHIFLNTPIPPQIDPGRNENNFKKSASTSTIYIYIDNPDVNSSVICDHHLLLPNERVFIKSIEDFSRVCELVLDCVYRAGRERLLSRTMVLDFPEGKYKNEPEIKTRSKKSSDEEVIKKIKTTTESNTQKRVNFLNIAGQARAVGEAKKLVLAINHPEIYEKRGVKTPKGILFYGPPGTGKTLIAKAIATEVNAELFEVSFSDIGSKWYGESEQRIQEVFDNANKVTKTGRKAIILFDELDSMAPSRNDAYEGSKKIVSIILQNLDGFRSNKDVLIIGTTNRPEDIDPALKRPGRIDKIIEVGLPDLEDRKAILQLHINKAIERSTESHDLFSSELDLQKIAESTDGMSGADLANILNLTLESKTILELEGLRWTPVTNADIERTLVDFKLKQEEKRKIGFN